MMNSAIILFTICAASAVLVNSEDKVVLWENQCDSDIQNAVIPSNCWTACMAKKANLMLENGRINKEKIMARRIPNTTLIENRQLYKQGIIECTEIFKENECETAILFNECIASKNNIFRFRQSYAQHKAKNITNVTYSEVTITNNQ